jgi:extradiol dioxygenase family protein
MARFYADENFSHPVVSELRNFGHDVLTCQDAGQAGKKTSDRDILAFAISQGRAVLTFNRRHFLKLHRTIQPHAGIVICTKDDNVFALASRIHQAVLTFPTLDNQVIRIYRPSIP